MTLPTPKKFETTLESYKTISVLGEGGSGRVFLVKDTKQNEFAIKCLFPELVSTERLNRFKNELIFSQKNTHPNILSVIDHGYLSGASTEGTTKSPFYVMRAYPSTLRKLMGDQLEPTRALELFQKLLDGIQEAHQRSIWHRDLKPENVLFDTSTSELVIADFGIAHFSQDELYTLVQTEGSQRLANFQYAAPEQRVKGGNVDQRADIYALGLIFNEMLTKEIPLGTGFKRVSDVHPQFSYLDEIIDRMIRQSPSQRSASVHEIGLELTLAQQKRYSTISTSGKQPSRDLFSDKPQSYRAEVDCVGRLDNAEHQTVLSISAGLSHSIIIPAVDKQKALSQITEFKPRWGKTRRCVFLYTILLFLLIKDDMKKLDEVVVDPEYAGYEPQIKNMLLGLLRKMGLEVRKNQIKFEKIDRTSPARNMASRVFKGIADPDSIVGVKQILEVMK